MRNASENSLPYEGFEIRSPRMKAVCEEVATYAFHGRNCIFFGPSGAGKEYLARHYHGEFVKERKESDKKPPFVSVNCAGFSPDLAHSALFGHVKGSFTTAVSDRTGAFEEAKNGIIFLDEAGDLDQGIQAIMNRALDPEGGEAHRLGSNAKYETKEITVIAATERPKENIRPSLLARLGAQINVPGLSDRPEDFLPAIAYFALRSLVKRRDIVKVYDACFPTEADLNLKDLVKNPKLQALAAELAAVLTPIAEERHWPGNFRSLRITVDTAIIRAEHESGKTAFLRDAERYFLKHMETYSDPPGKLAYATARHGGTVPAPFPRSAPLAPELTKKLREAFPSMAEGEQGRWARFLSRTEGGGFRSREAKEAHPNLTLRTIQNRLGGLVEMDVLRRSGPKGDIYCLASESLKTPEVQQFPKQDFLPLPDSLDRPEGYLDDRETLLKLLMNSAGLHISGAQPHVRTAWAAALGRELALSRPVYYWDFRLQDLSMFLRTIDQELQKRGIAVSPVLEWGKMGNPAFDVALLAGYVRSLLGGDAQAVLILDHVDLLTEMQGRQALLNMVRHWQGMTFVLLGRKMGNDLQVEVPRALSEYRLRDSDQGT
jgi:DNA-binding NtrC family response regulator